MGEAEKMRGEMFYTIYVKLSSRRRRELPNSPKNTIEGLENISSLLRRDDKSSLYRE